MFLDPTNDVAFRRIFGNENKKNILISFLNSVLGFSGDKEIVDVALLNTNQVPKIIGLKETILDVRCTDQRGVSYIVEMQIAKPSQFEKRVLYYTSKAYNNQIESGDQYPTLNQVIFIGIVNFNMFEGEHYISNHLILDEVTGENKLQDFRFCFIELPKFNLNEDELQTVAEKWIYFFKNAKDLQIIPSRINDQNIIDAFDVLERYGWTKQELELYDTIAIYRQDERGRVEEGYNTGFVQGKNEGIDIGARNERRNFLLMLLSSKYKISESENEIINSCLDSEKLAKAIEMSIANEKFEKIIEYLK